MSESSFDCLLTDIEICFDKHLGTGSFAEVFVATYHGTKVAAKRLHPVIFEGVNLEEHKGFLQSFLKELRIMNSLKHPNIVPFYGMFNSDNPTSLLFNVNCYFITELLTKSLQARNLEKPRLTIRHIVDIAIDIAAGLRYLHNNRQEPIMHGSLASRKVLLSVSGQVKIADIGIAKLTIQMLQSHALYPSLDCYSPSEKMIFNDAYDHSADVYAMGVIILEMAIGKVPTATQHFKRVGDHLEIVPESERRRSDFSELQTGPNFMLENVVMVCLQEKEKRVSANEVAIHLDKLKISEAYRSCEVSSTIEIKKSTPLEHHHDLKEIKLEIERLKIKTQTLEEKLHTLEHSNAQLQSKSTQYEKQIFTLMAERRLTNTTTQIQQTAQYVLSKSSQQLPHQMPNSLSMPRYMPGALEQLYLQSPSHQPPPSLRSFDQFPTPFHKFDEPLRSSHNFDQPPLQHQQRSLSGSTSIYNHGNFPDKDCSSLLVRRYSLPIIPTIQKEREYLIYQLSCMERVIHELESGNSNTSEKLIISFVDTLKDQIIKTGDYIAKLPTYIKTGHYLHELLQKIHQTVSYAHFDKISTKYTKDLDTAIKHFQYALAKTIN